ncbi:MAG: hypothetical protein HYY96_11905, partial [Candidatus Tectomicrobia bacterium]|nr:hypothetical protein [Candidatus Tectomicrobia bacterium]
MKRLQARFLVIPTILGILFTGLLAASAPAQTSTSATLTFESAGFDLETGTVVASDFSGSFPSRVDFHFAFNSTRSNPTVVFQDNG